MLGGFFFYNRIMGQLITHSTATGVGHIYFKDARYSGDANRYLFQWPSPQYPTILSIHVSHTHSKYNGSNGLIVDIREWIEDNIQETIIMDVVNHTYKVVRKDVNSWDRWDRAIEVKNSWTRFHFRKDESALAFKLKFGEFISPVTEKSPTDDYDYEQYDIYR